MRRTLSGGESPSGIDDGPSGIGGKVQVRGALILEYIDSKIKKNRSLDVLAIAFSARAQHIQLPR